MCPTVLDPPSGVGGIWCCHVSRGTGPPPAAEGTGVALSPMLTYL
jgi:hypothetical protein